jgi:peroxiredoxin family protein
MTDSGTEKKRSLSVICSKGSFDMAYPGLILANAARMAGVDARLFFTFWGLDIVNDKKIDHLHLNLVGNPSAPLPAMIAGLPGVEALATAQMRKEMERLEIPPIREFIEMLDDAGADMYGCQMALDMFKLTKDDLLRLSEKHWPHGSKGETLGMRRIFAKTAQDSGESFRVAPLASSLPAFLGVRPCAALPVGLLRCSSRLVACWRLPVADPKGVAWVSRMEGHPETAAPAGTRAAAEQEA